MKDIAQKDIHCGPPTYHKPHALVTTASRGFLRAVRRIKYNASMRKTPPPPWIRFRDLVRDALPSEEGTAEFMNWLKFLYSLPPNDLIHYEQGHPAPAS